MSKLLRELHGGLSLLAARLGTVGRRLAKRTRLAMLLLLLAAMVLGGDRSPVEPRTTVESPSSPPPVTAAALHARMPFPATCMHSATDLVNGRLSWSDAGPGGAWVDFSTLVLEDLTGDGIDDAAVVATCSAGGVGWGDYVLVYTMNPAARVMLLGYVMTAELSSPGVFGGERPYILKMQYQDQHLLARMNGLGPHDIAAAPSMPVDLDIWVGRGGVVETARARTDEGVASKVMEMADLEAPLSESSGPSAVVWGWATAQAVAAVASYADVAFSPTVRACFDRLDRVPWTPGSDDDVVRMRSDTTINRYCLINSPGTTRVLVMGMAPAGALWTVKIASEGNS